METSTTDISEDRIAALEQKLTEMEALVKGLIAELPGFREIARTMLRETEECNRQELKRESVVQGTLCQESTDLSPTLSPAPFPDGNTVIRPRVAHQPDVPVALAEPEMVRIMQSDGTMKLEPRYGETKRIDSSGGYGRNRKDASANSKQSPLIYAADKEKSDSAKT